MLLTAPSHAVPSLYTAQWFIAVFVPTHSGGSAPDLRRVPSQERVFNVGGVLRARAKSIRIDEKDIPQRNFSYNREFVNSCTVKGKETVVVQTYIIISEKQKFHYSTR